MSWNESRLLSYQRKIVGHIIDYLASMVWADMGLGKTVSTLTAIVFILRNLMASGVLIVAPLRVIQTVWRQEAEKWEHTRHLRFSLIHGTRDQRMTALWRRADVYLVNYENLAWLATAVHQIYIRRGKFPPFSMVVYDEVTKLKSATSKRAKAWSSILPYLDRRVGLTGEPAANGYKDLFGQYLMIDSGERLGRSITAFRERYLRPAGYGGYDWIATKSGQEEIHGRIAGITIELAAKDYLDLPELTSRIVWVDLPPDVRKLYDTLEREFFAELDSGAELEVFNEASKLNKLLQIASGAAYYGGTSAWEEIHKAKLEALQDVLEEAGGRPILLGYTYKHEAARIAQTWPEKPQAHTGASFLSSKLSEAAVRDVIRRWEHDEIPLLCGHPACLHPSTEVLTEHRGWRRIVDVRPWERVFDGTEFVSHSGCYLSGHKKVVDVFGIKMTPDHKLWVNGRWEEAASVRDRPGARGEALYQYQGHDQGLGEMFAMRGDPRVRSPKCREAQPAGEDSLPVLHGRAIPQHDGDPNLENLARNENQMPRYFSLPGSTQLQRTRDRGVRTLGELRELLRRYGRRLRGLVDPRTSRQQWPVLQGELSVGVFLRAASQQEEQPLDYLPGGTDPSGRVLPAHGHDQRKADQLSQQGDDRGRDRQSRENLNLQPWEAEKSKVYDLVNCGPQNRFVIRNSDGECFLSHNSMGHGLNLQAASARSVVWFSLPWSLELYHQLNDRLFGGHRRQGASVIHHILARDTMDEVVYERLASKDETQTGLRSAVKRYQERRR